MWPASHSNFESLVNHLRHKRLRLYLILTFIYFLAGWQDSLPRAAAYNGNLGDQISSDLERIIGNMHLMYE